MIFGLRFFARNLFAFRSAPAAGLVFAILCCAFGAASGATVSVHRNTILSTMPTEGIGVNMAVWYGNFNASYIPSALTEAGVTVVRYPGGSYSDAYHFATNAGQSSDGSSNISPIYVAPNTNFRNFMNLMTSGANPKDSIIAVDYGSSLKHTMGGQPQEAEAWVALANGNASLYGTANDINIGVDAEGNNWGTVGYWAHLRTLSSAAANADSNYNGTVAGTPAANLGNLRNLAMSHAASYFIQNWEVGNELNGNGYLASYWNWETDMHSTASGAARVWRPGPFPHGLRTERQCVCRRYEAGRSKHQSRRGTYEFGQLGSLRAPAGRRKHRFWNRALLPLRYRPERRGHDRH